jgi:hypothetical protein
VFALNLIASKFAKNPIDLIRCKFSIDGGLLPLNGYAAHPPFRNHTGLARGNSSFTIRTD